METGAPPSGHSRCLNLSAYFAWRALDNSSSPRRLCAEKWVQVSVKPRASGRHCWWRDNAGPEWSARARWSSHEQLLLSLCSSCKNQSGRQNNTDPVRLSMPDSHFAFCLSPRCMSSKPNILFVWNVRSFSLSEVKINFTYLVFLVSTDKTWRYCQHLQTYLQGSQEVDKLSTNQSVENLQMNKDKPSRWSNKTVNYCKQVPKKIPCRYSRHIRINFIEYKYCKQLTTNHVDTTNTGKLGNFFKRI